MECVNAAANELGKRNQSLLEEINEVITKAPTPMNHLHMMKTIQILSLLRHKVYMDVKKEEYISIHELLQHILDSEFVLNLIMTITYLSSRKIKEVKSILLGACRYWTSYLT